MEFDRYATSYNEQLEKGLAVSGESADFFASMRIHWLARCLRDRQIASLNAVLDFGCGVGGSCTLLKEILPCHTVTGIDTSAASLAIARERIQNTRIHFAETPLRAENHYDLIYSNGVVHHISRVERPAIFRDLFRALRPGAHLALWENNPLNPGTRWVMRRIPFDRDADPITAKKCAAQLQEAGFVVQRIDHLFIFPRFLRALRFLEPHVAFLPLGGQYQILCQKPGVAN